MCLYPKLIRNKRFQMYNIKAGDTQVDDERKLWVAIGCGNCIECRKQKAREWQVRLNEEIKINKYNYFVTLTFTNESLKKFCEEDKQFKQNVNFLASKAVRRFLERWRKKHKHSLKHWLITELGHENTERIHLHGILFSNNIITNEELSQIWSYGNIYIGDYCNSRTIGYVVKYVTKIDTDHKSYKADIFCSAGIGRNYIDKETNRLKHAYKGKETIQTYKLPNGTEIALPKYYRNHLWSQKERDQMWTDILDSNRTYVRGIRIDEINTEKGYNKYIDIIKTQQENNIELGYGDRTDKWKEEDYKVTFQMINNSPKTE